MRPPDTPKSHIVAAAALGALTEACRRSREALPKRSAEAAPNLLRGHAAQLLVSPIGRDQLLGAALLAAAEDIEHDRPFRLDGGAALPEPSPTEEARTRLRREVFGAGGIANADSRRVLDELEMRYRRECSTEAQLAERLREDAKLHEAIWDDPRLPCGARTRLVMLFSVPKLLARADELAPEEPASPGDRAGGGALGMTGPPGRPWALVARPVG